MNFLKKINLFNIGFLPIISITPICSSLSFKTYNDNNFQFTYEYIHSFSQNEYNFLDSNNQTIWQNNEILFQSNDFQIKFDSQNILGEFYLDLYNYNVNKWYFIKINYDPSLNLNLLNKTEVNNEISNIITTNWLNDVSVIIELDCNMALNGDKSKVLKDGLASFQSSWGVWNKTNSTVEIQYNLSKNDIVDSLKMDLQDESFDLVNASIQKLQYIPLIEILDPPIGYAKWRQNSIFINNNLISNNLNNKELDILLPNNSDSGQEWWKWFTNGSNDTNWLDKVISLSTSIIGSFVTSLFGWSGGFGFGTGFFIGTYLNDFLQDLIKKIDFDYNKNKILYDDYYNLITSKGYYIDLNSINLNLDSDNQILIKSNVEYGAKATAIFGDGTQARIFSNPAVAFMKCELRKYVQK